TFYALNDSDEFEWVWKTNRGTFPKRLASLLYKKFQIKLSPEVLSTIGNKIKTNTATKATIMVDFAPLYRIKWWYRGMFEDSSSCFWSERDGARKMMEDNGCWVFRLWSDKARNLVADNPSLTPNDLIAKEDNALGMGRAWIYP